MLVAASKGQTANSRLAATQLYVSVRAPWEEKKGRSHALLAGRREWLVDRFAALVSAYEPSR